MTTGAVKCWGLDSFGYLGGNKKTPVELAGLSGVRHFYWAQNKAYALTTGGVLKTVGATVTDLVNFGPQALRSGPAYFNPHPMANGHCAWLSSGGFKCIWLDQNSPPVIIDQGLPTETRTKDLTLLTQYYVFGS